ncbi:MAG: SRPBCC family protein [Candidatus Limnocylindria bacterium]
MTEGVITLERRIAAPPETVFTYFTDPERYRQWQGCDAELDARPGGVFRVTVSGHTRTVASGIFLEVEPPSRVVFTWGWEQLSWMPPGMRLDPGISTVEVTFDADGEGTRLTMRHGGLPSEPACRFHNWGWDVSLDRLAAVACGSDPGADPFADL